MTRGEWARPVVLTWLLLAGLSSALLLRATFSSPPGTVFVGTFYYVDDFYNYLSYVQQAEQGALVFRNKLAPPTLAPALVNLEWLLVGWLSALLGGWPLLAYRLVGFVALSMLLTPALFILYDKLILPRLRVTGAAQPDTIDEQEVWWIAEDADGEETIDLRGSPELRLFVTSLVKVFSGDAEGLGSAFRVEFTPDAERERAFGWCGTRRSTSGTTRPPTARWTCRSPPPGWRRRRAWAAPSP